MGQDRVAAIVIARGNSKGIARKNLKYLGDKPLVAWTIEAARNARCVDRVFLSTEDQEIAEVGREYGAIGLERPAALSADCVQSTEVFLFALRQININIGIFPKVLILLMPTSPFRTGQHIDEAYNLYRGEGVVMGVKRDCKFHWKQTTESVCGPAYHFPENRLGRQWMEEADWLMEENGSLYICSAEDLSLYRQYLSLKPTTFYVMPEEASIQIDTPYDFWLAERWLEYNQRA